MSVYMDIRMKLSDSSNIRSLPAAKFAGVDHHLRIQCSSCRRRFPFRRPDSAFVYFVMKLVETFHSARTSVCSGTPFGSAYDHYSPYLLHALRFIGLDPILVASITTAAGGPAVSAASLEAAHEAIDRLDISQAGHPA
jgi:hypothetical protein